MASKLLTVTEVAALMGVDPAKVYSYINKGLMKTIKLGPRGTRIPEFEYERFLHAHLDKDLSKIAV